MNIFDVIQYFLKDQKKRLKERTYRRYEDVMDHFRLYLDNYGYLHVEDREDEEDATGKSLSKSMSVDGLNVAHYSEFFEYFLVRKVFSSESFIKQSATVLRKFANWLFSQKHIDKSMRNELLDYFTDNQVDSLVKAERLGDLFYELATRSLDYDYEETLDDYFVIEKINPGELWFASSYGKTELIGPVIVPKEISNLCEENWEVSLLIGKYKGRWFVMESGNVYP